MHHAINGFVMRPDVMASQTSYSSAPPDFPNNTSILQSSLFSYRSKWSTNREPGYASPPIATPSQTPSEFLQIILLSSLLMPPDLLT